MKKLSSTKLHNFLRSTTFILIISLSDKVALNIVQNLHILISSTTFIFMNSLAEFIYHFKMLFEVAIFLRIKFRINKTNLHAKMTKMIAVRTQ